MCIFPLAYDGAYINAQDTYQARATITSGGQTIVDTVQPQRVLTNGANNQVQLTVAALAGAWTGNVTSAGYADYGSIDARLTSMYRKWLVCLKDKSAL